MFVELDPLHDVLDAAHPPAVDCRSSLTTTPPPVESDIVNVLLVMAVPAAHVDVVAMVTAMLVSSSV